MEERQDRQTDRQTGGPTALPPDHPTYKLIEVPTNTTREKIGRQAFVERLQARHTKALGVGGRETMD